jgi:hypothetical protein
MVVFKKSLECVACFEDCGLIKQTRQHRRLDESIVERSPQLIASHEDPPAPEVLLNDAYVRVGQHVICTTVAQRSRQTTGRTVMIAGQLDNAPRAHKRSSRISYVRHDHALRRQINHDKRCPAVPQTLELGVYRVKRLFDRLL